MAKPTYLLKQRLLTIVLAATPYMVNEGPGYANLQSRVFFVWGSFCFVCIACECLEPQRANIKHSRVFRTDP